MKANIKTSAAAASILAVALVAAGYAKVDNDKNEWIYVPEGTCEKIAGGVVKAPKKETKKDA